MLDESGIITFTAADKDYIRRFWRENDSAMLDMVWKLHPEVHRLNVFNLHPADNDLATLCGPKSEAISGYPKLKGGYIRAEFQPHLTQLADDLIAIDPNVVVALGNTPLWALCGVAKISSLRGTTRLSDHSVRGFKVLPTYHPAAVLRQWELRPVVIIDLMKAKHESEFPEVRRPSRQIWIEPTLGDIERFFTDHVSRDHLLCVDIETAGTLITCIGFSPNPSIALVVPFYDPGRKGKSYWPSASDEAKAWRIVKGILEDREIPKLFHNGLYDVAFLYRSMGIKACVTHDTMLLHHALQPESLKALGFVGSLYTDEGPWKQEHKQRGTIKRYA